MNKVLGNEKLWIALLSLLILPFLFLCVYIHPSADDFILTADTWKDGVFGHLSKVYSEWSGRYFGTFIVSVNPLVFGSTLGYKILPVFLLVVFYLCLYYFIKSIFSSGPALRNHLMSLIISLIFMNNIPSTAECFYWMSGSLTYFLPASLTFLLIGLFINSYYAQKKKVDIIEMPLLAIIIAGSNEICMLFLLECCTLFIIFRFLKKRRISASNIIFGVIILVASAIVIFAPGNYNRMSSFAGNADLIFSVRQSLYAFAKISISLIQDPAFIIVTMLLIAFLPKLRENKRFVDLIDISPFYAIPISFLIIFSLYFVVVYSTGLNPALRIHNIVMLVFIFSWLFNISILHNYLLKRNKILMIEVPPFIIYLLASAAFILTVTQFSKEPGKDIVCEGNIFRAGYDLVCNAAAYDNEMNDRNELISKAIKENRKYVELPALKLKPLSIYFADITEKTDNWINICAAKYYKLDSIKIRQ